LSHLQGSRNIGGVAPQIPARFQLSYKRQIVGKRGNFYQRLTAKDDHTGAVLTFDIAVSGHFADHIIHHRAPFVGWNTLRLVQQINYC